MSPSPFDRLCLDDAFERQTLDFYNGGSDGALLVFGSSGNGGAQRAVFSNGISTPRIVCNGGGVTPLIFGDGVQGVVVGSSSRGLLACSNDDAAGWVWLNRFWPWKLHARRI